MKIVFPRWDWVKAQKKVNNITHESIGGDMKLKLTKQSRKDLYNCYGGVGTLFVNTGKNEISMIDIHLGRNKKWYAGKEELKDRLVGLAGEIPEE